MNEKLKLAKKYLEESISYHVDDSISILFRSYALEEILEYLIEMEADKN